MENKTFYSEEVIRAIAPAAFAKAPSSRMSDRYSFVPTAPVIKMMDQSGWGVIHALQEKPTKRDPGVAKHALLFAPRDLQNVTGDSAPTIYLRNSHNGSKALEFRAGFYRFACANGLLVGDDMARIKTKHIGIDDVDDIIEGSFEIINEAIPMVENMRNRELSLDEREALALHAITLRTNSDAFYTADNISRLLEVHREDDRGNDAWHVFNRVQENTFTSDLKGRVKSRNKKGQFKMRNVNSRPPKRVDQFHDVNIGLWNATQALLAA